MAIPPSPQFIRALRADRAISLERARDSIKRAAVTDTRNASTFERGDRVVDTVTGLEGEVIDARQAHYIVPVAGGEADRRPPDQTE